MQYKKIYRFNLALVFSLVATTAAQADGRVYVAPGVGYQSFDNDLNLKDAGFPSLGIGYRFDSPWAIEFNANQTSSEFEPTNMDVDVTEYRVDGLYHLNPKGTWQPYVVAGVGQVEYDPDLGSKTDQEQINVGAGVAHKITDNITARGDLRALHGTDESNTDAMLNLSLAWLFGSTTPVDSDADGVVNKLDECPNTPVGAMVNNVGCALDSDRDGVPNGLDICPNTPAGVKVMSNGCVADADQDGVADNLDKCLGTPLGAKVDSVGCRLKLTENVSISMQLNFKTGSTQILSSHHEQLNRVGEFLIQYPDPKVVIEGHTDSMGDSEMNDALSLRRAQSAVNYLVITYKLDPSRFTAVGKGEQQPIADNTTTDGRAANRRVVALIETTVKK